LAKDAIEMAVRQIKLEKILLPHLAAAVGARPGDKRRGTFQPDRSVTERGKRLEIAPGSAAEIEDFERRIALDVLQQSRDVVADIVVARARARNPRRAGCSAPE